MFKSKTTEIIFFAIYAFMLLVVAPSVYAAEESGPIGVEGRISSPPPTQAATISVPRTGQSFTDLPITVSGLCPAGVLVKLFKNNVFSGSVMCSNGSFSLQTDLFNGRNDLVARVFDALDQAGPDSNTVTVNYTDRRSGAASRVSLNSNYAKRGANPGSKLRWPIILSGGIGPYAVSIDWGDGKPVDLISQEFPGVFDIEHIYDSAGVYNIIVKAVDANGSTAYLQLVGVGNGALSQDQGGDKASADVSQPVRIIWQPAAILIPLLIIAFWLGKRYEKLVIKRKLERGGPVF